ncbi:MAG: HU family DNA-binding protein, partial [Candidatus Methylomirabilales bacterium]
MTKAGLVAVMAKASGITKKAAETALETTLKSIRDSLKRGKKVTLVGFGTFSV